MQQQYVGGGTGSSTFYHPTPSPADSGVMSPMTPGSNGAMSSTGSATSPEHMFSAGSPYNQPSPADSGFTSNASPYPLTSPSSSSCGHENNVVYEPRQQQCGGGVAGTGGGSGNIQDSLRTQCRNVDVNRSVQVGPQHQQCVVASATMTSSCDNPWAQQQHQLHMQNVSEEMSWSLSGIAASPV
jgi:hypothetical protein